MLKLIGIAIAVHIIVAVLVEDHPVTADPQPVALAAGQLFHIAFSRRGRLAGRVSPFPTPARLCYTPGHVCGSPPDDAN